MSEASGVVRLHELDDQVEKLYKRLSQAKPNTPPFQDILRKLDEVKLKRTFERAALRQQDRWSPTPEEEAEERADRASGDERVRQEVAEAITASGLDQPAEKSREHAAPKPRHRPRAVAPIRSKNDVAPVLLTVLQQAAQAPLSDRDRRVLTLLFETGIKFSSTQVLCSREWMAKETGLGVKQCRLALPSLQRLGWITRLPNGPTIRWLRARWLVMGAHKRPVVVELRQRPWAQETLNYMAGGENVRFLRVLEGGLEG